MAQVAFTKLNAIYGIKIRIDQKQGGGGEVTALIANGDIRKDGTVYQIAYIPKSGTNIRYTVLLRYDTAATTLIALYSGKTVALKQAALEGTTWINADDPDGTLSGIRSITFINGEIRWVDANGNTQQAIFYEENSSGIWVNVDPSAGIPYNMFGFNYSGGDMTVYITNLGSTNGFTFTKQA